MSTISSICAEHHREIVQIAINKAKAKAKTKEVIDLLDQVLRECMEKIAE